MIQVGKTRGSEVEVRLSASSTRRIEEAIRQKYAMVSVTPEGHFRYPTGRAGLERLGYALEIIERLPPGAISSYCGVGNPFTLGFLGEGETLLDIGCGGGADTFVAAMKVGPKGGAVGIDITWEMLVRAKENLRGTSLGKVSFYLASAEELPFADESFDVVISNGVFNLIPDKAKALAEAFRVLKTGGRLLMADQSLTGCPPDDPEERIQSWFR